MGRAFASVGEREGDPVRVGDVVVRCAGFLATEGGGPLAVFCDVAELVEVERGAGGAGAGFLARPATDGTGVWLGGGGKYRFGLVVLLGGGAGGASIFLN